MHVAPRTSTLFAAVTLFMAALAAACDDSPREYAFLTGEWAATGETAYSAVAHFGDEHCDTQDVLELRLQGFVDPARSDRVRSYLRDPRDILRTHNAPIEPLEVDVELPADAIDLKLNKGNAYLYLERAGQAVYVVREGAVERWPVFPHSYGCD